MKPTILILNSGDGQSHCMPVIVPPDLSVDDAIERAKEVINKVYEENSFEGERTPDEVVFPALEAAGFVVPVVIHDGPQWD